MITKNTVKFIVVALILFHTAILGEKGHYPFCGGTHSSSNCRAYAMARAYGGTHCGDSLAYIGTPTSISGAMWDTLAYTVAQAGVDGYNIIAWGNYVAGEHAAFYRRKSGNNVWVDHKPSPSDTIELDVLISTITGHGNPMYLIKKVNYWDFTTYNDFESMSEGNIKINGSTRASGYPTNNVPWYSSHNFEAIYDEQTYGEGKWYLEKWTYGPTDEAGTDSTLVLNLYQDAQSWDVKAYYSPLHTCTFVNSYDSGGFMVDDVFHETPHVATVEDGDSYEIDAIDENTINGLEYRFETWKRGSSSISPPNLTLTATPWTNLTYTAEFKGYPTQVQNVDEDGTMGNSMHLTWDEHVNDSVDYNIYRKVQNLKTHQMSVTSKIAVVEHGTTEYTDDDYVHVRGSTHIIYYDVRGYYANHETEADSNFIQAPGGIAEKQIANDYSEEVIPESFNISIYPNPFNPIVTVDYSIPAEGPVEIQVYNILGETVATLVNKYHDPGEYSVTWNVQDIDGSALPCGLYLYVVNTPTKRITGKITYIK